MDFYQTYFNNKLTQEELFLFNQCISSHDSDEYKQLSLNEIKCVNDTLLQMLPYKHTNCWSFVYDTCATNLIQKLFNKYVINDDVLIITSYQEHPKVNKILSKYKNVLYLIDDGKIINMQINDILAQIAKYKFIFVYCIGTICGTGRYTDQIIFKTLKKILLLSNKPHIFVIDAVQELFMLPRDYSMFDYVIGTAHAIIPNYDIGFCITRKDYPSSFFPHTVQKFIMLFQIIKKRISYIQNFSQLLTQRYIEHAKKHKLIINDYSYHLWSIGDKNNTLDSIIPTNQKAPSKTINDRSSYNLYFRATWSLFNNDNEQGLNFIQLLHKLDNFLYIND